MTRFRFGAALALALACGSAHALEPTTQPVSPRGTPATIDVPASLHIRNTGGLGPRGPGTGAGLCVPTSVQVAARWHGLNEMEGFQAWCMQRPGGSWPQKLAADIKEFARSKGITAPRFVQHTGGDPAFLELVYRTRRMPAQTWTAAHMVNGAHLDGTTAAVIDNNRPGNWLWQTRAEYLRAWEASGPGWVFCWLAPPPPPGRPGVVPVAPLPFTPAPAPTSPSCPGPNCPAPTRPRPSCPGPSCPRWQHVELAGGELIHKLFDADGTLLGVLAADGWHIGHGDGWLREAGGEIPAEAPPLNQADGIDVTKLDGTRSRYWIDGVEVTRAEAFTEVLTGAPDVLTDDSGNHHLSFVLDDPTGLPAVLAGDKLRDLVAKCHVQVYRPDSWVAQTRLSAKVTLHAPAPKGGQILGTATGTTAEDLVQLLRPQLDPTWKPEPPPAPKPAPAPPACPNCPSCPDCPRCTPKPEPKPDPKAEPQPDVKQDPAAPPAAPQSAPWLAIAAAIAAGLAFRSQTKPE
ncbi:hypothetical protein R5W23_000851 [Gemmata sp. JC673]|uniref:Peptidase C39-like domain-containing protein n=1 Tax=Gemmata algarum TaxID=2975278 RepID=A0ABU5ESE6_9BACT|nr:hypothetical protein [Gemmata algarum]MDY3558130.1 hypothetical protein [Gemmata algarum]